MGISVRPDLYALVHLAGKENGVQYTMVHSPLDSYIPFIEYFVIPYLLWFVFIATTGLYFSLPKNRAFTEWPHLQLQE